MKHAFLIMIHSNYNLVCKILKKLDHPDNTIFIHVDAKSPFSKEEENLLLNSCQQSKVIMVDRYRVNWGGYSQVNIEMRMLEFAAPGKYDYYHFLSGVDFPTKPIEHILEFFEKNAGYEFIHFCSDEFNKTQIHRYCRYRFFQEKCGRANNIYMFAERSSLLLQKILKVDRTKKYKDIQFKSGSNWVSITHEFVVYLLSKQEQIKKMFSHTLCCDEVFMQTIAYNSPFQEKLFTPSDDDSIHANLRSVDWKRADPTTTSPYTYTINDYEELINSSNLFCRKVTDSTPEGNALIEKLEHL